MMIFVELTIALPGVVYLYLNIKLTVSLLNSGIGVSPDKIRLTVYLWNKMITEGCSHYLFFDKISSAKEMTT